MPVSEHMRGHGGVKFGYTIYYVSDVKAALRFFERVFEIKRRFVTKESDYGELDTGETVLAFASHVLGKSHFLGGYISSSGSENPLGVEFVLVAHDVNYFHERAIKHGAVELTPPKEKPWRQTVSYIRCPSGLLIELCTPVSVE